MNTRFGLLALAVLLAATGCERSTTAEKQAVSATPASVTSEAQQQPVGQEPSNMSDIRFVVDRSDRAVYVQRGDEVIRKHPVAVGKAEHETPTGSWRISKVDLNPEWIPPDSEWAKDRSRKAPGDPDNPMGRARLIFDPPYSIHGTDALESLGSAESHGSIRVANADVVDLARLVVQAGGKWEGDAWFNQRLNKRTEMTEIDLERPIAIEVRP